jgi:hypothetical protein
MFYAALDVSLRSVAVPADTSPENLYNPARYWLAWDHYSATGHPAGFGPYLELMQP